MDAVAISTLVLTSLSLLVSCISPLVTATGSLISNIRKSKCCNSEIEVEKNQLVEKTPEKD